MKTSSMTDTANLSSQISSTHYTGAENITHWTCREPVEKGPRTAGSSWLCRCSIKLRILSINFDKSGNENHILITLQWKRIL